MTQDVDFSFANLNPDIDTSALRALPESLKKRRANLSEAPQSAMPTGTVQPKATMFTASPPAEAVDQEPLLDEVGDLLFAPREADADTFDTSAFEVEDPEALDAVAPVPAPAPAPAAAPAPVTLESDIFSIVAAPVVAPPVEPVPVAPTPQDDRIEQLLAMVKELQSARAVAPAPTELNVDYGITAEELAAFPDALPMIQRVAQRAATAAAAQVRSELTPQIESVRATSDTRAETTARTTQETSERLFRQSVRTAVPDIDTLAGRPEFAAFISKKVQYGSNTVKDVIAGAFAAQELSTLQTVMADFRQQIGAIIPVTTAALAIPASAPSAQAVPTAAAANSRKKPMLKWSAMQKAHEHARRGKISVDDLNRIGKLYTQAEVDGRIDFNS